MAKVIALSNQKGGVGKTTTAYNFGAELGKRGYRVLLVDFDSQGNLTKGSGIAAGKNIDDIEETIATSIDACIAGEAISVPVYKLSAGLSIVPCNISMAKTKMELSLALARETMLIRCLKQVKNDYNYIIIDTAPSLDIDLINAFVASDEIIITSTPDAFSTSGTRALMKSFRQIADNLNPTLKIAGVLITEADQRTNFARDMIRGIKSAWESDVKVFNTVIPLSVRVRESQAAGKTIAEYENKNAAAVAYALFTDEYLKEYGEDRKDA